MQSRAQTPRSAIALCCLALAACSSMDLAPAEEELARPVATDGATGPAVMNDEPTNASATAPPATAEATTLASFGEAAPQASPAAPALSPEPPVVAGVPPRSEAAARTAPPSTATAATPPPAPAPAPLAPASETSETRSEPPPPAATAPTTVSAQPAAATLDFSELEARLRQTKAIGVLTKLSVKNEANDLLEDFRAYHKRQSSSTLAELRRGYDMLLLKLLALLQDGDPPLAKDIDRSRTAIWEILSDPQKFVASNLMAGA